MPKIEMTKKYRTRDGRPARVLCVDRKDPRRPVVAMVEHSDGGEDACYYTAEGASVTDGTSTLDLIEVTPFDVLKVDDLVMVRDEDGEKWEPYRFAGVRADGLPMTWHYGCCSFTVTKINGDSIVCWNQCRPATEAEIAAAREKNLRELRGE